MRARDFLLEYDIRTTEENFGDALVARCAGKPANPEEDHPWDYQDPNRYDGRGIQLLGLKNLRTYHWAHKILEFFQLNDPTGGKFVLPMVRWYLDGSMRSLEDAPKLKGPIATYVKFRNRIRGLDLKKVSFDEFLDAMEAQEGKLSSSDADKQEEQQFYDTGQADLVCNEEHLKIVFLRSMAASCYFGRNTRWCTTSRDKNENMFNAYAQDGPLFVILDKLNNKRWQFHFDLGNQISLRMIDHQFMNENDHAVNPLTVMDGQPLVEIANWSGHIDGLYSAIQEAVVEHIRDLTDPDTDFDIDDAENDERISEILHFYGLVPGDVWS